MIGFLRGTLVAREPPEVLIDVAGVGYEVQVPLTTLFRLPAPGETVTLLTHFVVREDAQLLFGFLEESDRQLFRNLIRVSGVGPRLALTILSGMDADSFARCVQQGDAGALVALPGVGRKTADRLLIELRDPVRRWLEARGGVIAPGPAGTVPRGDARADAESALVALGYKPAEASRMVKRVATDDAEESEELIRRALRASLPG